MDVDLLRRRDASIFARRRSSWQRPPPVLLTHAPLRRRGDEAPVRQDLPRAPVEELPELGDYGGVEEVLAVGPVSACRRARICDCLQRDHEDKTML